MRAPEREDDAMTTWSRHTHLVQSAVVLSAMPLKRRRVAMKAMVCLEGVLGDAALEAPEHEQAEAQPDEAREESGGREGVAERLQEVRELAEAVLAQTLRGHRARDASVSRARGTTPSPARAFGMRRGVTSRV